MVLRHFNLREQPFGVTPDPRYLFLVARHREALSSIAYGIWSGVGFVALTGQPGLGKTTILFETLRRFKDTSRIVFLFQTISSPIELVRAILIDLGEETIPESLAEMQSRLNRILVACHDSGKRVLLAIDEAQNLDESVLEAVRMLSNFETSNKKLIQIVLLGQPQFADKLASPQLLQLRQRISIFQRLEPLSEAETIAYIHHRLRVSGCDESKPIFNPSALSLIVKNAGGIPRNINNICANALSLACALKREVIDYDIVQEVLTDLDMEQGRPGVAQARTDTCQDGILDNRIKPFPTNFARAQVLKVAVLLGVLGLGFAALLVAHEHSNSLSLLGRRLYPIALPASEHTAALRDTAVLVSPDSIKAVEVQRGQTLESICKENLGTCGPGELKQLIRINSSIQNPNHIEIGQRVSIPTSHHNAADE